MDLAIMVPTRNRANVVEETLSRSIDLYEKMGIDVYYYDSSDDEATKHVVEKYNAKGYKNIKYIGFPEGKYIKPAVYYTKMGWEKEYDYIWPIKDKVWFEEPVLREVKKAMEEKHDVIFLGVGVSDSYPDIETNIYDKQADFYRDWAWRATSLDLSIFKYDSMIRGVTYEEIAAYNISYHHYELMFKKLATGEKHIKVLMGKEMVPNEVPGVMSEWKKNVFKVWKDDWINVNERLPELYDEHKPVIIKQATMLPWLFGTINAILGFKRVGALREDNIDSVLMNWERVSDIPAEKVRAIAAGIYDVKHDIDFWEEEQDEFLKIIYKFIKCIDSGTLTKASLPYGDILKIMTSKILEKYGDREIVNVMLGSVEDIIYDIINKAETKEEICHKLQLLATMTILLNNSI